MDCSLIGPIIPLEVTVHPAVTVLKEVSTSTLYACPHYGCQQVALTKEAMCHHALDSHFLCSDTCVACFLSTVAPTHRCNVRGCRAVFLDTKKHMEHMSSDHMFFRDEYAWTSEAVWYYCNFYTFPLSGKLGRTGTGHVYLSNPTDDLGLISKTFYVTMRPTSLKLMSAWLNEQIRFMQTENA